MRIFVAGATGVLGAATLPLLIAAGHEVTAIARTPQRAEGLREQGATPVTVDMFDQPALRNVLVEHRCDTVLNLATHIPVGAAAARPGAWAANDRIRRDGSAALAGAALAAGAARFVQEGVSFVYADGGDAWLDEDAPLAPTAQVRTVLDAAAQARRFTDAGGVGVTLWFGQFYGDDPLTRSRLGLASRGLPAVFGEPDGWATSIYIPDAGAAVLAALSAPSGRYNVGDTPMRHVDQAAALAAVTGRDRVRIAGPALLALGGAAMRMLGRSQRVSSRRFRGATGWEPRMPDFGQGLRAISEV